MGDRPVATDRDAALLRAAGLAWDAGVRRVLGPLDLAVERGECLAVVGPNGSGKTTLLRLLAGLLRPAAGTLAWRGVAYRQLGRRELARRLAYVPQVRPARVPITVEQLVLHGRYPHLTAWQIGPAADDLAAVERALDLVGILPLRRRLLDELSGGERQSAYVAAALAQEAELLILDEPTTHLDPRHQREIAAILLRLRGAGGHTVIAATHDLVLAARVADRVLALREGWAVACDAPARVIEPRVLAGLFEAPFQMVRGGERPVTILELDP